MNKAHIHLMVNHLPVILPIAAWIVMLAGFIIKSAVVKRAAYLLFFIGAITTLSAMGSGDGAEDVVEKLNGVSEKLIEEHEESAELFSIFNYVLGLISLVGIWASLKEKFFSQWISIAVLIFTVVVIYLGKETGTTGGEIRHQEIRKDFVAPPSGEDAEHTD